MSVTVAELLKLPSLRQAKVLGGRRGLSKIVFSISVLESIDPKMLIGEVFPQGEFYGSELVITGFLNTLYDVDCQCANIRRLAEGGEVGLILFYVGAYLPKVDRRLIDLADELDFALICMPEGQKGLRYSDVITDVTERIFQDRERGESITSDILARVSTLPEHLRTVNTVLKMLSDALSATVILCDEQFHILNLFTWPRGLEEEIKDGVESLKRYPPHAEEAACSFLPDSRIYRLRVEAEGERPLELLLLKEGKPLNRASLEQSLDTVRLGIVIWGRQHGEVAIHELVRAILQDEPMKMRRLADIFHIDVASIHEMWLLCGDDAETVDWLFSQADTLRGLLTGCVDTVVLDREEDKLLFFLSEPESLREAERRIGLILELALAKDPTVTLTRYGNLQNTGEVRKAYLSHQICLEDARKLFPRRRMFAQGETEYAQNCRELIGQGEERVAQCLSALRSIQKDKEGQMLVETLCVYLLDSDASVTRTAEMLHLHKNTLKYRMQRISNLLGYHPDKMPETAKLYQAVCIHRLLNVEN